MYVPLLEAFIKEIQRAYADHGKEVTNGLIKYLLGSNGNDYYKLIHHNKHNIRIIPYNLCGTLNQSSISTKGQRAIKDISLPSRILDLSFKEDSRTTAVLTMDNGWSISFRIHNASTKVEHSLKFDIQLVGQLSSLFFIDKDW